MKKQIKPKKAKVTNTFPGFNEAAHDNAILQMKLRIADIDIKELTQARDSFAKEAQRSGLAGYELGLEINELKSRLEDCAKQAKDSVAYHTLKNAYDICKEDKETLLKQLESLSRSYGKANDDNSRLRNELARLQTKLKIEGTKEYHWTSKDGKVTPVSKLEANHLINIACLLQRMVESGDYCDGGDANETLGHILKEIKRRGLKV